MTFDGEVVRWIDGDTVDLVEHRDVPLKLNLIGKRTAVQHRDDSQNYLQLRNKRF